MNTQSKILFAALLTAGLTMSASAFAQAPQGGAKGDQPAQEPADQTAPADATDDAAQPADQPEADTAEADTANSDTAATAEVDVDSDHPAATNSIVLAPHVGVLFPQLTSDLNTWPLFGLSAGYILPFDAGGFERPLEIGLDVMYTQPGADGSGTDPNLGQPASDPQGYDWELTQRMVVVELYGLWRFMAPGSPISAYAMAGPRAYFMESEISATSSDGQDFGPNTQTNDEYGLVVGGGADFAVGPGTIYGTLEFGWSDLNQRITGDSNTGALALDAGYRLYF